MNKIYISENTIVAAIDESDTKITGYNLFTEELVVLNKKSCFKITTSIIKLLGNDKVKVLLAKNLSTNQEEAAKILNVVPRTYQRQLKAHCTHEHS